MPDFTDINGLQIPVGEDFPNIETAFHPLATGIDNRSIPIFATAAARSLAMPQPVEGQLAYVQDHMELFLWNGSSWISAIPRWKVLASNQTLANTTYANVTGFSWPVEASSHYAFFGRLNYQVDANDDIKFRWVIPSGASGQWRVFIAGSSQVSVTADMIIGTGGVGEFAEIYGGWIITGGSSGTVQLQVAKNTDVAADGTLFSSGTAVALTKFGV